MEEFDDLSFLHVAVICQKRKNFKATDNARRGIEEEFIASLFSNHILLIPNMCTPCDAAERGFYKRIYKFLATYWRAIEEKSKVGQPLTLIDTGLSFDVGEIIAHRDAFVCESWVIIARPPHGSIRSIEVYSIATQSVEHEFTIDSSVGIISAQAYGSDLMILLASHQNDKFHRVFVWKRSTLTLRELAPPPIGLTIDRAVLCACINAVCLWDSSCTHSAYFVNVDTNKMSMAPCLYSRIIGCFKKSRSVIWAARKGRKTVHVMLTDNSYRSKWIPYCHSHPSCDIEVSLFDGDGRFVFLTERAPYGEVQTCALDFKNQKKLGVIDNFEPIAGPFFDGLAVGLHDQYLSLVRLNNESESRDRLGCIPLLHICKLQHVPINRNHIGITCGRVILFQEPSKIHIYTIR